MKKFFLWTLAAPIYTAFAALFLAITAGVILPDNTKAEGAGFLLGLPLGILFFWRFHIAPINRRNLEAKIAQEKMESEKAEMALLEKEKARLIELEEKRLANEKKEAEKQRKLLDKKRRETENLIKVVELIGTLKQKSDDEKIRYLEAQKSKYLQLRAKIEHEVELLEDIRSRHPMVGTFLITRSVSDGENEVQRKLATIFNQI